jgi:hypothetical protein
MFVFKSNNPDDKIEFIQKSSFLPKEGSTQVAFFLIKNQKNLTGFKTDVEFEITADNKVVSKAKTTFFSQPK